MGNTSVVLKPIFRHTQIISLVKLYAIISPQAVWFSQIYTKYLRIFHHMPHDAWGGLTVRYFRTKNYCAIDGNMDIHQLKMRCFGRSLRFTKIPIWLVVWNIFYFSIYWEFHHPNWWNHIFSEGWLNHQPAMKSPNVTCGSPFKASILSYFNLPSTADQRRTCLEQPVALSWKAASMMV